MQIRILGAILVVAGCGACGFLMAANHRKEERTLRQLIGALDYMECELQYHLTPLPDLCRQAAREASGVIQAVLTALAQELEDQISPDVESCMRAALLRVREIPSAAGECLGKLGTSLGRFDLPGQLKGLDSVRGSCRMALEKLERNREERLRSYQTLGLCAGAALAILLL